LEPEPDQKLCITLPRNGGSLLDKSRHMGIGKFCESRVSPQLGDAGRVVSHTSTQTVKEFYGIRSGPEEGPQPFSVANPHRGNGIERPNLQDVPVLSQEF